MKASGGVGHGAMKRDLLHRRQRSPAPRAREPTRSGICAARTMLAPVIAWGSATVPLADIVAPPACKVASTGNGAGFASGNSRCRGPVVAAKVIRLTAQLADGVGLGRLVGGGGRDVQMVQRQPGHLGAEVGCPDMQRQRGNIGQRAALSATLAAKVTSCSGGGTKPCSSGARADGVGHRAIHRQVVALALQRLGQRSVRRQFCAAGRQRQLHRPGRRRGRVLQAGQAAGVADQVESGAVVEWRPASRCSGESGEAAVASSVGRPSVVTLLVRSSR